MATVEQNTTLSKDQVPFLFPEKEKTNKPVLFVGEIGGARGAPLLGRRRAVSGVLLQRRDELLERAKKRGEGAMRHIDAILDMTRRSDVTYVLTAAIAHATNETLSPGGLLRDLLQTAPAARPVGPLAYLERELGDSDEDGIIASKNKFLGRSVMRMTMFFANPPDAAFAEAIRQLLGRAVLLHPAFRSGFLTDLRHVGGGGALDRPVLKAFEIVSGPRSKPVGRAEACESLARFQDFARATDAARNLYEGTRLRKVAQSVDDKLSLKDA